MPSRVLVGVQRVSGRGYTAPVPYHPGSSYPELAQVPVGESNHVYDAVRRAFAVLGLDAGNHGTPSWNPLGAVVRPGDRVLIKPNLIWHSHRQNPQEWHAVITHGSVVRAVLDYVLLALGDAGHVTIADGPQLDADWRTIIERTGLDEVVADCRKRTSTSVQLCDLRDSWMDVRGDVKYGETPLGGDPAGSSIVDLGETSRFYGFAGEGRYYGADYDDEETNRAHQGSTQRYRICRSALDADVIVNIPKLKTHKKVGVTLSLKNLVGVNAERNWLPHYTVGAPDDGGDQFPARTIRTSTEQIGMSWLRNAADRWRTTAPFLRTAKSAAKRVWGDTQTTVRSGNWHGNDTCWRMVHDINRAVLYSAGSVFPAQERKRTLVVIDGVVAGEGNGPESPRAVHAGLILAGLDPVAVDWTAATLMGFDPNRIPQLARAFDDSPLPLASFAPSDIVLFSDNLEYRGPLHSLSPDSCMHFEPHFGWLDAMERR